MRKLVLALALLALAPFALAACGGDDDEESADTAATTEETTDADGGGGADAGGGGVAVSAVPDGSLAFEQDELSAPAGSATFEFTNPASLPHDFCIEEGGSEVGCADVVSDGESSTLDADLESGEYTFYCSVAGHREGGMEGTLTVE
jgi:plastocyanin